MYIDILRFFFFSQFIYWAKKEKWGHQIPFVNCTLEGIDNMKPNKKNLYLKKLGGGSDIDHSVGL